MHTLDEAMMIQRDDYRLVAQAIRYIETNYHSHPSLDEIARSVHLSKYHFQRLFTRWAGISPNRFLQYLTISHAKARLSESASLLGAAESVGLSSTGRLHDLFVTFDAITPGEYGNCGAGIQIVCGVQPTPFGDCLIGQTGRGICALEFLDDAGANAAIERLKEAWPLSAVTRNDGRIADIAGWIFGRNQADRTAAGNAGVTALVKGTNFQIKVWEALLRIEPGQLVSYRDLAARIGQPEAARAVGQATARNSIAYLIPCHRVIRETGVINQYKWGSVRKKAIIGWEAAQCDTFKE